MALKESSARDWFILMDADELIYEKDIPELKKVLSIPDIDWIQVCRYNMWTPTEYRVDGLWFGEGCRRIYRNEPKFGTEWTEFKLAARSMPNWLRQGKGRGKITRIRMMHLGYIRPEDRKAKYERFMKYDAGKFHNLKHLQSIIERPTLKPFPF